MTRMTSLIMVVGEQIKCFLSSLGKAHANVAGGQCCYGRPSLCYKVPALSYRSYLYSTVHI
jgi:hypothetical protein